MQAGFYWRNTAFQDAVDTQHVDFLGQTCAQLPGHLHVVVDASLVNALAISKQQPERAERAVQAALDAAAAIDWTAAQAQVRRVFLTQRQTGHNAKACCRCRASTPA